MKKVELLLLVAGIIILIMGFNSIRKANLSSSWNSTEGTIIKSELDSRRIGPKHSTRHKAIIRYQYNVENIEYTSENLFFGYGYRKNINVSKKYLQKYPAGKKVTVYYNPTDLSDAVLEEGGSWQDNKEFWGGIFLIVLSLILFIRRKKFNIENKMD